MDYRTGQQRFGVTYFQNRITDLIVFDSITFKPMNVGEASINGVELAYDGTLFGLELRARLTLQNPINDVTDKRLPRRAEIFGNAGVARSFGPVRVGAEVVGAGERFDSLDEAPASEMDGYVLLNLVATYSIARNWNARAALEQRAERAIRAGEGLQHAGQQRVPVGPVHTTMIAATIERSLPMKVRVTPVRLWCLFAVLILLTRSTQFGVRRGAAGCHDRADAAGRNVDPPLARLRRADGGGLRGRLDRHRLARGSRTTA